MNEQVMKEIDESVLCKVDGCQEPAVMCAECSKYVCHRHGQLRDPERHGAAQAGVTERLDEWLCKECSDRLSRRTWSRLSN